VPTTKKKKKKKKGRRPPAEQAFKFHGFLVREFTRKVIATSLSQARAMYDDSPRQIVEDDYAEPTEVLFDITDPSGACVFSKEDEESEGATE
jgi:hypothetical protein